MSVLTVYAVPHAAVRVSTLCAHFKIHKENSRVKEEEVRRSKKLISLHHHHHQEIPTLHAELNKQPNLEPIGIFGNIRPTSGHAA